MMSCISGCTLTGDLSGATHIRKIEATAKDPNLNVLVTWTQIKTFHKQQTSHIQRNNQTSLGLWNTTLRYGFHFQHRSPGMLSVKTLWMIVDATWFMPNIVIQRDLQEPTAKEAIHGYSSQCNARLSVHPNDLVVNLMVRHDNSR
jgi:hypothetical protein